MISSAAVPVAATAATYYVATDGNDGNSCSASQSTSTPKRTVSAGLECLRAGDTLYIRAGVYSGGLDSNRQSIPSGTSWSSAVTIAAYPGEKVVLQASGESVVNFADSYIQYVIFDGITFDGVNLSAGSRDKPLGRCQSRPLCQRRGQELTGPGHHDLLGKRRFL